MGWDMPGVGITDILTDPLDPCSDSKNILRHHGELELETIQAFDLTCSMTGSRAAQDNYAMYRCIMNSVKKNTLERISIWHDDYNLQGCASGNCLFKVLCRESGLDAKSTTSHIRKSLTNLDLCMKEVGNDALKFNTHARGMIRSLNERGKQTFDLITHLTKGHMGCQDKAFRRCISDMIERDEDDPTSCLTPEILMVRAANKHKTRIQSNTWLKPDDIDKELMAPRAEACKKTVDPSKKTESIGDKPSPACQGKRWRIPDNAWDSRPVWSRDHKQPDKLFSSSHFAGCQFYHCCDKTGGKCGGAWVKHKPKQCKRRRPNKPHKK